jgi:hypothetical protein
MLQVTFATPGVVAVKVLGEFVHEMPLPPSVKATVPVGEVSPVTPFTIAVKVKASP